MSSKPKKQVDLDKDEEDVKRGWEGYSWESSKVRSWEQIEEDPTTGRLKSYEKADQVARKKRIDDGLSGVRRGVIRFCVVVLDMSQALRGTDLKPSRAELIVDAVSSFATDFFDHNPISQLALVVTRDGEAHRLSSFSSNDKVHKEALQKALAIAPEGNASLQNACSLARKMLESSPPYGMREIIVCYGSLSTCDPGDVHAMIEQLAAEKIRCSAVAMAAELYILKTLTSATAGSYVVALNEEHFKDSLAAHVIPPPTTARQVSASLIRMGFPVLRRLPTPAPFVNNPHVRGRLGYNCPRCNAWLSDMPCECTLCALTLVSSPHLARSYHHLFPVPKFHPLDSFHAEDALSLGIDRATIESLLLSLLEKPLLRCAGCYLVLPKATALRLVCPACLNIYCVECDVLIHDSLHYCPGCGLQKKSEAPE